MKRLLLGLAVPCLLLATGSITKQGVQHRQVLEDCLTLEWETGGSDVRSNYLLVRPTAEGIAVDQSGNLFVIDEDRIKVFDSGGQELRIVGRPGQGPGEFENCRRLTISETGFLTVVSGTSLHTVHMFSPELKYLDRFHYSNEQPYRSIASERSSFPDRVQGVISYNLDERVYSLSMREYVEGFTGKRRELLLHEKEGSVEIICEYPSSNYIHADGPAWHFDFLGTIHWGALGEHRIVYSHSKFDVEQKENGHSYTLHIHNLKDGSETLIEHSFDPIPIVDRDTARWRSTFRNIPDERSREDARNLFRAVDERLRQEDHKASLLGIYTDRQFVFAMTYSMRDTSHVLTDVFDTNQGIYIGSMYLPCYQYSMPSLACIRDGYAYEISDYRAEDPEEPLIRKYRIDPSVFRNP